LQQRFDWKMMLIFTLILVFLGGIYLQMSSFAKEEHNVIRLNNFEVQKVIQENISGDYNAGLKLVDGLMAENENFNQKVIYEILDEIIKTTPEVDLLPTLRLFMKNEYGTLNIYDLQNNKLIVSLGKKGLYIPQPNFEVVKKSIKPGSYNVVENPFPNSSIETATGNSRLYYYFAKNKPWLMVINRPYDAQFDSQFAAEKIIMKNTNPVNLVNQSLRYKLIVISPLNVVISASDSELVGQKVIEMKKMQTNSYHNRNQNDRGLYAFKLKDAESQNSNYIGLISDSGQDTIAYVAKRGLFYQEENRLNYFLLVGLIFNASLAFFCIKMMMRNYMYFVESQDMEDEK
jgi:hypothetical protein